MDDSEYSSSPDPIVLPSSPPSGHVRYRLDGNEGRRTKSPAKTFIIDTPGVRGKSPFRIRLTVEPQSDSGSVASIEQPNEWHQADYQKSPIEPLRRTASVLPRASVESTSARSTRKRKRELVIENDKARRSVVPSATKSLRATQSPRHGSHVRVEAGKQLLGEHSGEHTLANEDFTMISGDSLASIKANNSVLGASHRSVQPQPPNNDINGYDEAIVYPDLQELEAADVTRGAGTNPSPVRRAISQHQDYDAMSWQPSHQVQSDQQLQEELLASQNDAGVLDEDIWAEEASRSLEEDAHNIETADFVPPIFSDEVQAPLRSKIPKTWRKASGVNLSYSDSPAQAEFVRSNAQSSPVGRRNTTQQSVSRSPSASALHESAQRAQNQQPAELDPLEDSELTNPDAAATQLQTQEQDSRQPRPAAQTPRQAVRGIDSPSADETGLFWHTDRKTLFSKGPLRPRYQREELPNLSGILNAHTPASKKTPAKLHGSIAGQSKSHGNPTQLSSGQLRPRSKLNEVYTRDDISSSNEHLDTSHSNNLASLSNFRPGTASQRLRERPSHNTISRERRENINPRNHSTSPQPIGRAGNTTQQSQRTYGRTYFGKSRPERQVVEAEQELTDEPSQSYEEHLNRLSPGKLKVNFQDSVSGFGVDDRLRPSRAYPSLFGNSSAPRQQPRQQPQQQLGSSSESDEQLDFALDRARKTSVPLSPEPEPGLMGRIASTFWSTLIRARGPIYLDPKAEPVVDDVPVFPPTLRARIRARYGVLQEQHPWTMMHMRTLHRMVKSILTRRSESIIPTTLRLPQFLVDIVNTVQQSAIGGTFEFSFEHACAIWSFMQILVPLSLVRAMERGEVEWLGDDITKSYRGRVAGRWGAELCFRTVSTPEGLIDWQWLVACLGCVLYAEDMTDAQDFDYASDEQ